MAESPYAGNDRNYRLYGIMYQCRKCGLWTAGPFKNRRHVEFDEFSDTIERLTGHRPKGRMDPAERHPAGLVYSDSDPLVKYSGGYCSDCALKDLDETRERRENLRRKLTEAPPEPAEGLEEPKAPEPHAAEEKKGEGE